MHNVPGQFHQRTERKAGNPKPHTTHTTKKRKQKKKTKKEKKKKKTPPPHPPPPHRAFRARARRTMVALRRAASRRDLGAELYFASGA